MDLCFSLLNPYSRVIKQNILKSEKMVTARAKMMPPRPLNPSVMSAVFCYGCHTYKSGEYELMKTDDDSPLKYNKNGVDNCYSKQTMWKLCYLVWINVECNVYSWSFPWYI